MLIKIFQLLLMMMFASLEIVADIPEYSFESYMDRSYHVTDRNILPLTYYIIASKPQTIEEGFKYLRSGKEEPVESIKVFSILGTLLSAYPTNKYDAEIRGYVEDVENSHEHFSEIIKAYTTLAKIGTTQTLKMLQERSKYEFWKGKDIPSLTSAFSDRPDHPTTDNAQSVAISRLGSHQSPQAKAFLLKLQEDQRYLDDPILKANDSFGMGLKAATKEGKAYRQRQIDEALALKESIFGAETAVEVNDVSIVETLTTPPAPGVEEEAEESTAPEPETEKHD